MFQVWESWRMTLTSAQVLHTGEEQDTSHRESRLIRILVYCGDKWMSSWRHRDPTAVFSNKHSSRIRLSSWTPLKERDHRTRGLARALLMRKQGSLLLSRWRCVNAITGSRSKGIMELNAQTNHLACGLSVPPPPQVPPSTTRRG